MKSDLQGNAGEEASASGLIRLDRDARASSELRGGVVAIGNFDGVHAGHRHLIGQLVALSERLHAPALVLTFDPPPLRLLRPAPWPLPLTTLARRAELLKGLGVAATLVMSTTPSLLALGPDVFFSRILGEELRIRGMVEGPNFRFGRDREGDIERLRTLCEAERIELRIVEPQQRDGLWISSSLVREWLEAGEIERANEALMEPYRISGRVGHGAARGRTLGFPTANLEGVPVLVPAHGVYAGRVIRIDGGDHPAVGCAVALHVGPNPTFGEGATKIEAHVIDFDGDLYDTQLELELYARLRGTQKFSSRDALVLQLQEDRSRARAMATLSASGAPRV